MQLNQDQTAAAAAFSAFVISPDKEFVISGPAGTGKTTLLRYLMEMKDSAKLQELVGQQPIVDWKLTATTNKAAEVLQKATGYEASTIHSLLGLRVQNDFETGKTKILRTKESRILYNTMIVVDECSMVDTDLRKYISDGTVNCKLLYVGDHCQLAPVMETLSPVFSCNEFVRLEKVMRSLGAPDLTALCAQLRQTVETGVFQPIHGVPGVIDYLDPDQAEAEIQATFVHNLHANARILCFTNDKVVGFNNYLRTQRNLPEQYTAGEWVISNTMSISVHGPKAGCLRVEEEVEIYSVDEPTTYDVSIAGRRHELPVYIVNTPGGRYRVPVNVNEYRQLIAYLGREKQWHPYFDLKENIADLRPRDACTVYKAQGSTYHTVFVDLADIGRCTNPAQAARMLYVACSRPTDRICFIGQLPDRFRGG